MRTCSFGTGNETIGRMRTCSLGNEYNRPDADLFSRHWIGKARLRSSIPVLNFLFLFQHLVKDTVKGAAVAVQIRA
jgi:hypothetical protein